MNDSLDLLVSRAILIGTADYRDPAFLPLPAAGNSLTAMRQVLTDPDLCGWPKERVTFLKDRADVRKVVQALRQLTRSTSDVLLIYFVGHGVLLPSGELCLILKDTVAEDSDVTGMEFNRVREAVIESPAKVKIVILDCCYSGRAIQALSASHGIADYTSIAGTYTLTASDLAAHVVPLDQQRGQPTSFTGQLTSLIREGVPGGPAQLTFDDIYPRLRQRLDSHQLPDPNQRGIGTASSFPFCRNRAFAPERPVSRLEPGDLAIDLRFSEDHQQLVRKRSGRLWLPFFGLACLAVAALAGWMLVPGSAANKRTPPAYLASYEFAPYQYGNGLVIAREWMLRGQGSGIFTEAIAVRSTTGKALHVSFDEPLIGPIKKDWRSVHFGSLRPALANRSILRWMVDIPARDSVTLSYQVRVHVAGVAGGWLTSWARQFQAMLDALNRKNAHIISLRSVKIRHKMITIVVDQSTRVILSGLMSNGTHAPRSILSTLHWRSADPGIATVNSSGLVRGMALGSTRIIVGSRNITASVAVVVTAANEVSPTPDVGTSHPSPPPRHSPSPSPSPTTITPTKL